MLFIRAKTKGLKEGYWKLRKWDVHILSFKSNENNKGVEYLYINSHTKNTSHCLFPGGSGVKNPRAMQEMQVWSLDQKGPLEKEMATHPREISWTEEPGRLYSPWGLKRVRHYLATKKQQEYMLPVTDQSEFLGITLKLLRGRSKQLWRSMENKGN